MYTEQEIENAIENALDKIGITPIGHTDDSLLFPDGVASMGELDSLMAIQLAVELEGIMGCDLLPAGFQGSTTIGDVRKEIHRQVSTG